MVRSQFVSFVTAVTIASSVLGADGPRPMHEMQGGCDNYRWDMRPEFSAVRQVALPLVAARSIRLEVPKLSPGRHYRVTLSPEAEVALPMPPQKSSADGSPLYGGLLQVEVAASGTYRLSSSGPLWFDMVPGESKRILESSQFEMQTRCELIFKSVEFALESGIRYWIQLSSSRTSTVSVTLFRSP